jgi:hypothetical protein
LVIEAGISIENSYIEKLESFIGEKAQKYQVAIYFCPGD